MLAEKLRQLIEDKQTRKKMENYAKKWAGNFNWEKASKEYLGYLTKNHS